jgi:hypothetical protein
MLYGMQGMSDVPEVRSVLGMLPVAGRLLRTAGSSGGQYAVRYAGHEQ